MSEIPEATTLKLIADQKNRIADLQDELMTLAMQNVALRQDVDATLEAEMGRCLDGFMALEHWLANHANFGVEDVAIKDVLPKLGDIAQYTNTELAATWLSMYLDRVENG